MFENVDLIVGPTVPKLPHKIGEKLTPMEMYAYDILTVIANLAGIPAGSIKAGEVDNIPVGLQLQAKPLDDLKIIKAMSVLQNTQWILFFLKLPIINKIPILHLKSIFKI